MKDVGNVTNCPAEVRQFSAVLSCADSSLISKNESGKLPKTKFVKKLVMRRLKEILKDYDKQIRPTEGGPADVIGISLHIKNMRQISEVTMEYTTDIYFRQHWLDPRLSFLDQNVTFENVRIDSISERIWHPDTFFRNEISSFIHSATVRNEFLGLDHTGLLFKSTRYTVTASCPMDLRYFPMDTQTCTLVIESYGFNKEELQYMWTVNNENEKKDMRSLFTKEFLPNFKVDGYRINGEDGDGTWNGTYSTVTLGIQLSRYMGYYLIQIYWPCASLVIVSWFGFWMDDDCISERISLGATTILTITMLSSSINANSPKIPYVKAVDVYVGICFLFVFAALVENIAVGYVKKKTNARNKNSANAIHGIGYNHDLKIHSFQDGLHFGGDKVLKVNKSQRNVNVPSINATGGIDFRAKIIFPIIFALANAFYWFYYLNASKKTDQGLIAWKP
ncbi:unnamed protein product [Allacma fusca]|uniref:Uncharacterized protein n=1 Tax=Allacma fusca TaxID=39272 RepID=A0A8J2JYF1_9HEXA|nr:unnamed protein product [Allacma fusca]